MAEVRKISFQDHGLSELLTQLGVSVQSAGFSKWEITKEAFDQADLSFELFKVFAKLTTRIDTLGYHSTATRLWRDTYKQWIEDVEEPSLRPSVPIDILPKYFAIEDPYMEDRMDREEVFALKILLNLLDKRIYMPDELYPNPERDPLDPVTQLKNVDMVKSRINEISAHACWLDQTKQD